MKAIRTIASYRQLRNQPVWRLLAADNGPTILGLLQAHLYENERRLPASLLYERIGRELETLRAQGEDLPQTAQAYVANWLTDGYLERRFPANAVEEEYELSTASVMAIRFVSGLVQPHSAATESRLTLVIDTLKKLAEDTDTDKFRRIERLEAEQLRLENEIQAIHQGQLRVLADTVALERVREIIMLVGDLASDFRRVRDEFEQLNRDLRGRIMDEGNNRGEVLDALFAGIDLISESEAGRTFAAFWRLLTDPEQAATLETTLEDVTSRRFFAQLETTERKFLLRMTQTLLEQGGAVHDVLQMFARSLKNFVQSQEFLEQRRLNQVLREAQRTALAVKEEVRVTDALNYTLNLTSSNIRSVSQWTLYDPSLQALPEKMVDGAAAPVSLDAISELVIQSEIDFRTLKNNILAVLANRSQATIADVLISYPAQQGLGSVVGLMVLASRYGHEGVRSETVTWIGQDSVQRSACIPQIFFLRERVDELV